jgi:dUTP pyrophosphatase
VVDSGYRGEVTFRFKEIDSSKYLEDRIYDVGDRIGQMIIIPFPKIEIEEVEELSSTERGEGGYGSSGT